MLGLLNTSPLIFGVGFGLIATAADSGLVAQTTISAVFLKTSDSMGLLQKLDINLSRFQK
jgi:hypothetical protein